MRRYLMLNNLNFTVKYSPWLLFLEFYSYLCTVQWNGELLRKLLILVFLGPWANIRIKRYDREDFS